MNLIDWLIVLIAMIGLSFISFKASRYMKSVADFLSGSRCAGRYLLTISGSMSSIGAISVVAMFEVYCSRGFSPVWWSLMMPIVSVVITLSGWVYYRFRETRCMTMAQFYEVRYSKRFRIYSGIITWLSGIVNFGIFPAVASRFFIYFCGLPTEFQLIGIIIPTFAPVMLVTLGLALLYTCLGGQITVMVSDCVQGMFCSIVFVIVCYYLMYHFSWVDITTAMQTAPLNASMVNPYHTSSVTDFNFWFYLITVFCIFYGYMSWQGSQGYFSSALNPHEQQMGKIIELWRMIPQNLMVVLLPVCAFAFLTLTKYSTEASQVNAVLAEIKNPVIATQMKVPIALSIMLPQGIKGLFCAIMIFFLITTQDTYLHSWGSIFVQDVILPFRKKPFNPETQVKLLRCSIIGVGIFAFIFSLLFKQSEYILMFFAITGAIVAGAGAVIIGGLYWKRGTTTAAYTTMTIGWIMAVGRIMSQQIAPYFSEITDRGLLLRAADYINGVNSQVIYFFIMLTCVLSYVITSLLTTRKAFNMNSMLHRGEYTINGEHIKNTNKVSLWTKVSGITEDFTFVDKLLAIALVVWNFGWFGIFLGFTVYNLLINPNVPDAWWGRFWEIWIWMQLIISVPVTIWFTCGGILDIKKLFARLNNIVRNDLDDGRVVNHHSTCDE